MKNMSQNNSFQKELEAVFMECEKSILNAVTQYERDIRGALEVIKHDCLKRTSS